MIYLLIVSFIWAFSFGLIKGNLTDLDANFVALVRMLISFVVFIPFLRFKGIDRRFASKMVFLGMVQYGLMYITYIHAYQFLKAHQVALFTIFTPLYITLINDLLGKRFHPLFLFSALLAVLGMGVVVYQNLEQIPFLTGFLLVQASNLCFAFGQVFYKREMNRHQDVKDRHIFALLYLGALLATALAAGISTPWPGLRLAGNQVWTLLYLSILASGICFFLWNYGAKKTNVGALAILNNLKVPLAVACSILFFHEQGDIPRLFLGGGLILAALFLNESILKKKDTAPHPI